ncbi:hypothetical protein [Bradyrhizobium sp. Leo121]|uniref:hypothetical protein n=1 Tax=Bradyrhizobium sp. Leo121 TaxID=1571195 RepID=UPI0013EF07F8|nr:hypothetical protein [Bradyrhizobium sp. Leo121]
MAYGKLPVWIAYIDAPPMTLTQDPEARAPSSQDPASWPKIFDLRSTTKKKPNRPERHLGGNHEDHAELIYPRLRRNADHDIGACTNIGRQRQDRRAD